MWLVVVNVFLSLNPRNFEESSSTQYHSSKQQVEAIFGSTDKNILAATVQRLILHLQKFAGDESYHRKTLLTYKKVL